MFLLDQARLDAYMQHDAVMQVLGARELPGDDRYTSHRWLKESAPKRLMYQSVYGDILGGKNPGAVLDVGGGFTALTRVLMQHSDYRLLDINAHDNDELVKDAEKSCGRSFWINSDWWSHKEEGAYGLVVANDLFPNVDQRLELFLERYLPRAKAVRVSLTFHTQHRFYLTRRVDADEILCMLAWNGDMTSLVLKKYAARIIDANLDALVRPPASIFPNQRQVAVLDIKGDL
jgi:hypothetical protein